MREDQTLGDIRKKGVALQKNFDKAQLAKQQADDAYAKAKDELSAFNVEYAPLLKALKEIG